MILESLQKKSGTMAALTGFNNLFIVSGNSGDDKTVSFPEGFENDSFVCGKFLFPNGHTVTDINKHLKINNIDVVCYNSSGNLIPIANYLDSGNNKRCLQKGIVLDLYHIEDKGDGNPAWVVVGNPVILHYENFDILADGTNTGLMHHPVNSFYWTHNSENPKITFGGGTWEQIKGVFLWAKEDSQTAGNKPTDGVKTVTLTANQIPSHNHTITPTTSGGTERIITTSEESQGHTHGMQNHTHNYTPAGTVSAHKHEYTPAGTVASHSHSFTPKGTVSKHKHGLNSHTHSMRHIHWFTPSGTVSSSFSGTAATISVSGSTSEMSFYIRRNSEGQTVHEYDGTVTVSGSAGESYDRLNAGATNANDDKVSWTGSVSASGSYTPAGSVSSSFSSSGGWTGEMYDTSGVNRINDTGGPSTTDTTETTPTFSGTAGTTGDTQPLFTGTKSNTENSTPTFTGTAKDTGGPSNNTTTDVSQHHTHSFNLYGIPVSNTGGGKSHSNMPPYLVEYCWKRTA